MVVVIYRCFWRWKVFDSPDSSFTLDDSLWHSVTVHDVLTQESFWFTKKHSIHHTSSGGCYVARWWLKLQFGSTTWTWGSNATLALCTSKHSDMSAIWKGSRKLNSPFHLEIRKFRPKPNRTKFSFKSKYSPNKSEANSNEKLAGPFGSGNVSEWSFMWLQWGFIPWFPAKGQPLIIKVTRSTTDSTNRSTWGRFLVMKAVFMKVGRKHRIVDGWKTGHSIIHVWDGSKTANVRFPQQT